MKSLRYIIAICAITSLMAIMGCDSGGEEAQPNPAVQQVALLVNEGKPWVAQSETSVLKDGFDVSDQFEGFNVTFSEGTFKTENAISSAWPAEGNWQLSGQDINTILRGDGVAMKTRIIGNTLTLTFTAGGPSGGRINSVEGEYQFELISQ
ncbi:hypothetical protein [Fulvivirga lutea]|uniref:Lipocalin-like domain-containing protein n=1 Tax=Fulvivirga lutea TaxID=2810512 RepID=A0A974WGH7_9BACT|nr:hypothetical protein [Fulvivirga lutea]QSE97429.1 hypothetical protein JR347_17905 [Fulvivirga lutea]